MVRIVRTRLCNQLFTRPGLKVRKSRVISCPEFPVLVGDYPFFGGEQLTGYTTVSEEHSREAAQNASSPTNQKRLRDAN